jgi:hypothetical protein
MTGFLFQLSGNVQVYTEVEFFSACFARLVKLRKNRKSDRLFPITEKELQEPSSCVAALSVSINKSPALKVQAATSGVADNSPSPAKWVYSGTQ